MKVVPLPLPGLNNIPAMLRRLADDIEAGEYGDVNATVTVAVGEKVAVFGFGETPNQYHAAGVLHAGIAEILGG